MLPPLPVDCILPSARTNHQPTGQRRLPRALSKVLLSAKGRGGTDPDPFPSPRTFQQPGPGLEQPFAPGDGSPGRTRGFAERKQHCRCKFQRFIHFPRAATAHSESRSVLDPSPQTPPGTHRPLHPPGPGEHPGICG